MGTEVEIDFKDRKKAMRFKKHIEKTHPSTRGKVKIEDGCLPKIQNNFKFNPLAQAKRVTKLL